MTKSLENLAKQKQTAPLLAILILVVCVIVLFTHWPALSAEALSFDDDLYLTDNALVQNPSWNSARTFLAEILEPSTVYGYYQPLAMISLMLDHAMGGSSDNLMPFHRTSLALHIANTALIIVLLYILFGQVWVAAGVGLLFGLHPMTVESIPWVAERKTVLAAFFAFWSLILYVQFVRKNKPMLYFACLATYVLALMSKPTTVPLPALMLLMAYWPLRKFHSRRILQILPLLIIGAIFAIITYASQARVGGVVLPSENSLLRIPLIISHNIIFYLHKIFWPTNLSSFYAFPEPFDFSNPMLLAAVIATCILIILLIISLRWTPALLTGCLFFFIAIFPTLGVIGFTVVIASDKYIYLPSLGLLMILASLLTYLSGKRMSQIRNIVLITTIILIAGAEAFATRRHLLHWRTTLSIHQRMAAISPNAAKVQNMLGLAFEKEERIFEAIDHYRLAIQIDPNSIKAHFNLGLALAKQSRFDEAIVYYRNILRINANDSGAHCNLADALKGQGKLDEAVKHYRYALNIKPDFAQAHNNLGIVLATQGQLDNAIDHFHSALQIKPDYSDAHFNLGRALVSQGNLHEAIISYETVLQIRPDYADAHVNLATTLKQLNNFTEAINHYRQAIKIDPNHIIAHNNLANTLMKTGRTPEALAHLQELTRLKPNSPDIFINIAHILATDPTVRDINRAIGYTERAAQLTGYQELSILDILARTYANAGRFDDAINTAQQALMIAAATGNHQLADRIRQQIEFYRRAKNQSLPTNYEKKL